ncbi:alpha/beta fold hydrolase [Actinopolymorpha singaporensis]|uniref:Pimeloyl-ACP methyl ester carboxylesterase n=1 Tax=Actinopolymorpha singaporensis TaxID=117157 RepID=A0A1H1XMU9_9ACTN|nr:alpha/beta fold hydrolase [Actinopolymorpha singaporensis]SDT10585.1 Pimeloyl-ACP methyl ester carboxylesterase [Actinopolymorpha singaporensis]
MRSRTYRQRDLACTEYTLDVPLDHSRPDGERIEVYAREVVDPAKVDADLPRLVYLQGGPGGKGHRPTSRSGWLARALRDFRVVLLDQRGTGLSTPANRQTLPRRGDASAQAEYLTHFRADSIVADAELLRRELQGDQPWSALGQSYGGFCALTYLSFAPEGLKEVYVTGGLPPLRDGADEVYALTYERTAEKNAAYFDRHPGDRDLCARIVEHLRHNEVQLPTGERLTPRRFQTAGMGLGMRGNFDGLHYLLEEAFVDGVGGPELSDTFLAGLAGAVSFATNPLYAVLHEPIYCQGVASDWSAERLYAQRPEFALGTDTPFLFTGEMIYPFVFDADPALVPLRDAADLLAAKDDWPALYDPDRLARNEVPTYAAVYYEDMYVAREHSLATANAVGRLTPWITNEHEHDGLRQAGVFGRLLDLARETP